MHTQPVLAEVLNSRLKCLIFHIEGMQYVCYAQADCLVDVLCDVFVL